MTQNKDIPIYMFTGMLESGKTSFFNDTLKWGEFEDGNKTLLILMEDGEVVLDERLLKRNRVTTKRIEDREEITEDFFSRLQSEYNPDRIVIEGNGMWNPQEIIDSFPENWMLIQCVALIDGKTFESYLKNLGSIIMEQVKPANLVVFNRVSDPELRGSFRRRIKALNKMAQILYEDEHGNLDDSYRERLPFDITKDFIELEDDDFGLWYLSALENPEKYKGKKIKFRGIVYKEENSTKDRIVVGRFAMTCCEADIQFIGFVCHVKNIEELNRRDWVEVVATIKYEYCKEYKGKGVVLYTDAPLVKTEKGEQLVYFS